MESQGSLKVEKGGQRCEFRGIRDLGRKVQVMQFGKDLTCKCWLQRCRKGAMSQAMWAPLEVRKGKETILP